MNYSKLSIDYKITFFSAIRLAEIPGKIEKDRNALITNFYLKI